MSAPDLLKALELCRPHIEALSVSDDDPAIKRLLKYVDAAISNSPVDAVPVAGVYLRRDGAVILCQRGYEMDTRLYAHPVPAKNDGGAA